MGGAIITEGIFNIHGVGGTLWNAIIKEQTPDRRVGDNSARAGLSSRT